VQEKEEEGTGQYPFAAIESKWQAYWEANDTFRTDPKVDMNKPKFYALDMFPYPRCAPGRGGWASHPTAAAGRPSGVLRSANGGELGVGWCMTAFGCMGGRVERVL
jgi:hypothetical protein